MNLKKHIGIFLSLLLAAALTSFVVAQDTTSPGSQGSTAAAGSDAGASQVSSKKDAGMSDGALTQQEQTKFSQDPAFANVQVSVTNHTAMITGTVASKAEKRRAKDLAKSISGVKHVKDELKVNSSAGTSSGSKSNEPTNAENTTSNGASSTTSASVAQSPSSGETSATSANPNSQASSTTGSANAENSAAQQATTAPSANAGSATAQTASSASENNMAGQGPTTGQSTASSTPASTGGVSGAAVANPPSSSSSQSSTGSPAVSANAGAGMPGAGAITTGVGVNDTATLQSQIQNALQNEPTLHNDNLSVNVTDNTIELGGNVQTGKEKETARRIASSFAGNRRVKDRVTVSGKGSASSATPASNNLGSNPAGNTANPPNNNSQNPSANNPAANGDASANPR